MKQPLFVLAASNYALAQARALPRGVRPPDDLEAHESRIELYERRVARGLEPFSGRRPSAPDEGRSIEWLAGELSAEEERARQALLEELEEEELERAAAAEERRLARASWR